MFDSPDRLTSAVHTRSIRSCLTRLCLGPVLALLLGSCQPPGYDILASASAGGVVLRARGFLSWFTRDHRNVGASAVHVRDRNRYLWVIVMRTGDPRCRTWEANAPWPLRYGKLPDCFETVVSAAPLPRGVLIKVEGAGGFRDGFGLFEVDSRIRNYEDDVSSIEQMRVWPSIRDPLLLPEPMNVGASAQ